MGKSKKSSKQCSHFSLEYSFLQKGYSLIGGVDEVGRGCLAGPVVAAVVAVASEDQFIPGIRDSKKMTQKQREERYSEIKTHVEAYGIGQASNDEIDKYGIIDATRLAMYRATETIRDQLDIVLVDGRNIQVPKTRSQNIIKGDSIHYVISAASVLAKVYRDDLMRKIADEYDVYGFESNVGYGTKQHRDALAKYGYCDIHRKSFSPIKEMADK